MAKYKFLLILSIFLFSLIGFSIAHAEVKEYVTLMSGKLPSGTSLLSCAPSGDSIYCFGGFDSNYNLLDKIFRYDINTDSLVEMNSKLPYPMYGLSCAPLGDYIYCLGGYYVLQGLPVYSDNIIRYDPRTDSISIISAKLPTGRSGLSCTSYGNSIYCFGGLAYINSQSVYLDEIVKFYTTTVSVTTTTTTSSTTTTTIPTYPQQTALKYAYLFLPNSGGMNSISEINITDPSAPKEVSRHYTVPSGWYGNPSRTAIDHYGNAWIGNRATNTLVKVGNLGLGTCVDKNGNGKIDTTRDTNNDGVIEDSEMVSFENDECILKEVALPIDSNPPTRQSLSDGAGVRAVCIDANDNVYAGLFDYKKMFYISKDGQILKTIDLSQSGCRPYGCVVDKNGYVWISCVVDYMLVKYDPKTDKVDSYYQGIYVYGLTPTAAGDGVVFNAWEHSQIRKIGLDGSTIWSVSGPYQGRGITVDKDDNIYAVGSYYGEVWKLDKNGNKLKSISGVCNQPTGIGLDYYGNVWVACYGDGQIVRLDKDLNVLNRVTIGGNHYVYSDWTGYLLTEIVAPLPQYPIITPPSEFLNLIPMLLGNPLFFIAIFALAIAAKVESVLKAGGYAFVLSFLGIIFAYAVFSGIVPWWVFVILFVLIVGGIMYFKRK